MSDASMDVVAIIPIKPLSKAKSRLAPFLDGPKRQRLAINMLRGVIKAALQEVDEVWVLGSNCLAEDIAKSECAGWRREAGADINESLKHSFQGGVGLGQGTPLPPRRPPLFVRAGPSRPDGYGRPPRLDCPIAGAPRRWNQRHSSSPTLTISPPPWAGQLPTSRSRGQAMWP